MASDTPDTDLNEIGNAAIDCFLYMTGTPLKI
jgi:hypothetical protein